MHIQGVSSNWLQKAEFPFMERIGWVIDIINIARFARPPIFWIGKLLGVIRALTSVLFAPILSKVCSIIER